MYPVERAKSEMSFDYESIRAKNQETLIHFLDGEMNLGGTFAQSALLSHVEGHLEHYEQAKHFAKRAVETVERFKSHVVDARTRNQIGRRLAVLQKVISTL